MVKRGSHGILLSCSVLDWGRQGSRFGIVDNSCFQGQWNYCIQFNAIPLSSTSLIFLLIKGGSIKQVMESVLCSLVSIGAGQAFIRLFLCFGYLWVEELGIRFVSTTKSLAYERVTTSVPTLEDPVTVYSERKVSTNYVDLPAIPYFLNRNDSNHRMVKKDFNW
jgi:hypothetical protein